MITIGSYLRGPELEHSPIDKLIRATSQSASDVCGDPEERVNVSPPWVNVVFYVPGSLGKFEDLEKIEAARFSRKQGLLLVAVPVSEEAKAEASVEWVVDVLRKACAIASEVFAKKGVEGFELAKAEAVIGAMKPLIAEKFAALLTNGEKPGQPLFYNYDPTRLNPERRGQR